MDNYLCDTKYSSIEEKRSLDFLPINLFELSSVGKIDLKIVAFTDFAGGYSRLGRDIIEYLNNSGRFNIKFEKLKSNLDIDPFLYQYFNHLTKTKIDEENCIELLIGGINCLHLLKNTISKYKIAYTMAETLAVPDNYLSLCNYYDELFVPTELDCSRFFYFKMNYKISKMPLWVDAKRYSNKLRKANLSNVPKNNFIFMFVGSWNKRKGIEEIISAFIEEFTDKENVSLVFISKYSTKPFNDKENNRTEEDVDKWNILWEYENILKKRKYDSLENKPHICILDVPMSENILPHIMKNADVGISASRGESTWLPGLEFGSLEISCIQTNWGGHLEYLDSENSYLVDFDGFEQCDNELCNGISQNYVDCEMAKLNIYEIRKTMRLAYIQGNFQKKKKDYRIMKLIRTKYRKEMCLEKIKNRLLEISQEV